MKLNKNVIETHCDCWNKYIYEKSVWMLLIVSKLKFYETILLAQIDWMEQAHKIEQMNFKKETILGLDEYQRHLLKLNLSFLLFYTIEVWIQGIKLQREKKTKTFETRTNVMIEVYRDNICNAIKWLNNLEINWMWTNFHNQSGSEENHSKSAFVQFQNLSSHHRQYMRSLFDIIVLFRSYFLV